MLEVAQHDKEYLALRNDSEAVSLKLATQGKPNDAKSVETVLKMIEQDYKLGLPSKGKNHLEQMPPRMAL